MAVANLPCTVLDPRAIDPEAGQTARRFAASEEGFMTSILQKALKAIATIRTLGDEEDGWLTESTRVRFGVRYTDATHDDALIDEGWTDRAEARARRKELRASGAVNVYLVKITTRRRRRPRQTALEKVEAAPPISEPAAGT